VIGNDFGGLWATNFACITHDSLASNQWQPLNSFLVVASGSQRRMPYLLPRLMIENVRFPNCILSAEPNSSVFMMIGAGWLLIWKSTPTAGRSSTFPWFNLIVPANKGALLGNLILQSGPDPIVCEPSLSHSKAATASQPFG